MPWRNQKSKFERFPFILLDDYKYLYGWKWLLRYGDSAWTRSLKEILQFYQGLEGKEKPSSPFSRRKGPTKKPIWRSAEKCVRTELFLIEKNANLFDPQKMAWSFLFWWNLVHPRHW